MMRPSRCSGSGTNFSPTGYLVAQQGRLARTVLLRDGMETDLGSKQVIRLRRGDVVSFRLSGAGGYGDPRQRDSLQVRRDVRNGYISEATARDIYGC